MASWTIRRLEPRDVEAVLALWRRARWDAQPWLEERMGHTLEDDRGFFQSTLEPECELWVACRDGCEHPVAMLALRHEDALARGKIEQLYVDPPDQGQGVGSALIAHAKARCPAGLSLFAHQRNGRARGFYEARAFDAVAFGVSPPPESEPDVEYRWLPPPQRNTRGRS